MKAGALISTSLSTICAVGNDGPESVADINTILLPIRPNFGPLLPFLQLNTKKSI